MPAIVLTRDAQGCARYARALAPLVVVPMPVTRAAPPADPAALGHALALGEYTAIVCASARAAEALVLARLREPSPHPWPDVWAVGSATASVLAAAGIRAVVPAGVVDASTLATALVAHLRTRGNDSAAIPRVLAARAKDGRDEGLAILRAASIEVVDVTVYRTLATASDDPALEAGLAALSSGAGAAVACAVFAPSQVAALDALLGIRAIATPFVAIGETTAAALRAAGAPAGAIAVALAPTPEGLAKAVAAVYPPRR